MKIAFVRLSSMGDVVMSMTALPFVKRKYPNAHIEWVVDHDFFDVVRDSPYIDHITSIRLRDFKRKKCLKKFFYDLRLLNKLKDFDIVIDVQGLIKSAIVSKLISKNVHGFDKKSAREGLASILYKKSYSIPYERNTVLRHLNLVENALDLTVSEDDLAHKPSFLGYKKETFSFEPYFKVIEKNVLFVIGSTWPSRNYPIDRFIDVANQLQENCLILSSGEEQLKLAKEIERGSKFAKILPEQPLNALKALIDSVDLVIGCDTGPTTMAWGLNTKAITLFGPTPPSRILNTAYNRFLKSSSVVNPCKLDKNDFSIKEIKPENVANLAKELLYTIQPPPKTDSPS